MNRLHVPPHFDGERVWLSPGEIHTDNCLRFKFKANKGIEYNSKLIANKWKTFNWINIDFQSEIFNTIGSFHKWYSLCSSVLFEIFGDSYHVDSYHEYQTIEILSRVASHNANLLFIAKQFSFRTLMLFNCQNNEVQCEIFGSQNMLELRMKAATRILYSSHSIPMDPFWIKVNVFHKLRLQL